MAIGNPFAFRGRIARLPFLLLATCLLTVQQMAHHVLVGDYWFSLTSFANPWLTPLSKDWRSLFGIHRGDLEGIVMGVPIAVIIAAEWMLVALTFRRAETVGAKPQIAALSILPFVQVVIVAWLASRSEDNSVADAETVLRSHRWQAALIGILAGSAIAVGMTIVFTLVLSQYGSGLFVGVPLFIGAAAGYAGNRAGDVGTRTTYNIATAALGLASLALIGFALEGAVCLILALPLTVVLAMIGSLIGRIVVLRRQFNNRTFMSISLLPLLLVADGAAPPRIDFESVEAIEIDATPARVWDSVIHMGPIRGRPSAPFGWGLAYPMRGTIHGSGVGAIREGVFSTGIAYERVTRWEPGHALDFEVQSDPPALRELSPFATVNAPHVRGYFKTIDARFLIEPLTNGRTRLTLTTSHQLNIGPTAYWQPIAQWAIHANKRRVLRHFRDQAEAAR